MQVPFHETGNMASFEGYFTEMRDNFILDDTLTYFAYGRGRSAIKLHWKDSKDTDYPMFISDFDDIMQKGLVNGNKITGKFTAVKKGSNYGIKMIMEEE